MSKQTKEKQQNRKLKKPTGNSTIPPCSQSKLLNINPMYLLTFVGVIIAGMSLWYPRKNSLQKVQESDDEDEGPRTGGETLSNFFGPTLSDLRGASEPSVAPKKQKKQKPQKHIMDPFEAQRHNQGVWTFDD